MKDRPDLFGMSLTNMTRYLAGRYVSDLVRTRILWTICYCLLALDVIAIIRPLLTVIKMGSEGSHHQSRSLARAEF